MATSDHNRILATAASEALVPLGCNQKGRSRTWLDDHGWWIGVIEFQPSAWSKGSYLNVGACWLWFEKDYFSFDDGNRVESFQPFEDTQQFSTAANILAEAAKGEVLKLRARFPTIQAAASCLCEKTPRQIWDSYHAGVAAGLIGDAATAKACFEEVCQDDSNFPWVQTLKRRTSELGQLVADNQSFRTEIAAVVVQTREKLKLPQKDNPLSFETG